MNLYKLCWFIWDALTTTLWWSCLMTTGLLAGSANYIAKLLFLYKKIYISLRIMHFSGWKSFCNSMIGSSTAHHQITKSQNPSLEIKHCDYCPPIACGSYELMPLSCYTSWINIILQSISRERGEGRGRGWGARRPKLPVSNISNVSSPDGIPIGVLWGVQTLVFHKLVPGPRPVLSRTLSCFWDFSVWILLLVDVFLLD